MATMDLGNLIAHLRLDGTQFVSMLNTAEKKLRATSEAMGRAGRTMTMRVTLPLVGLAAASVKAFASFDDAMTKSLALYGDVSDEMRKKMEQTAGALSKKSTQSSTDLAKAYFYLGSAGLNATQSMTALSAVERFATAGSFDLSQATEMAVGSQAALALTSKDAEVNLKNLTRVTDVLTAANELSQATISQFAEALTNEAAAAMKTWGIQLEEGTAILAAYAKQNIKGSEAGSAFGRMLRFMMMGARENAAEWKKYGLELYDVETGNLRPLADVIGDMTVLLGGMSAKTKSATLDMLGFAARSQQVILPLLGMSDEIRNWGERLNNAGGRTQALATANLKSFTAQMIIAWHHIKGVAKDIGATLAPVVLKMGEHLKAASTWWMELSDTTKLYIIRLVGVTAAIGPVLIVLSKLGFAILGIKSIMIGATAAAKLFWGSMVLPASLTFVAIAGYIGAIAAEMKVLTGESKTFREGWDGYWDDYVQGIKEVLSGYASIREVMGIIRANADKLLPKQAKPMFEMSEYAGIPEIIKDGQDTGSSVGRMQRAKEQEIENNIILLTQEKARLALIDDYNQSVVDQQVITSAVQKAEGEAGSQIMKDMMAALKEEKTLLLAGNELRERATDIITFQNAALAESPDNQEWVNKKLKEYKDALQEVVALEASRNIEQLNKELDFELTLLGKIPEERERAVKMAEYQVVVERMIGIEILKTVEGQRQLNAMMDLYAEKLKEIQEGQRGVSAFNVKIEQWLSDATNLWANLGDVAVGALDGLTNTLNDLATTGTANFKSFVAGVLGELNKMIIKMMLAKMLMAAIGALNPAAAGSAGTPGTEATGQNFLNTGKYAMGAMFNLGKVVPMANGFVTDGPTLSPMALMGEAGPEAVMPLSRGADGKLGVKAQQQSSAPVVNKLKVVNVLTQDEALAAMSSDAGEKIYTNFLRRKGII